MTNLLGPEHVITTSTDVFIINESQFIGERGYIRTLEMVPRIAYTSNGNVNYKQGSTPVPMHKFQWDIVMPQVEAYLLVGQIEAQIFEYKLNNARSRTLFTLNDKKLGIVQAALPSGTTTESIPNSNWVFATFKIIFTKVNYERFGRDSIRLRLSAVQAL